MDSGPIENGEEGIVITKYSQVKKTRKCLDEIQALHPDDEDVIDSYNDILDGLTQAQKRYFCGSKTYIVLTALVGIFTSWMNDWEVYPLIMFPCFIALYIMSTMKPLYLINRQILNGRGQSKFLSAFLMGVLGLAATAPTYVTITEWSDGTTTKEEDNSLTLVGLAISFVVVVMMCSIMVVIALINYLRNYIIHI